MLKAAASASALMAVLLFAPVSVARPANITFANQSGQTVWTLNVSPSRNTTWEEDILGEDTLANGASVTVSFEVAADQCLWDVRYTYEHGERRELRGLNLCERTQVTLR